MRTPVFMILNRTLNIINTWRSMVRYRSYHAEASCTQSNRFPKVGILPVDIFGQCADFTTLNTIAKKWTFGPLTTVPSHWRSLHGKKAAPWNNRNKNTFILPNQNRGALWRRSRLTNDPVLADKLLEIRKPCKKEIYTPAWVSHRLDAFQAFPKRKVNHMMHGMNAKRNANRYHQGWNSYLYSASLWKSRQKRYHQYSIMFVTNEKHLKSILLSVCTDTYFFIHVSPIISTSYVASSLNTACPVSDITTPCHVIANVPEMTDQEFINVMKVFTICRCCTTQSIKSTQATL
jgi:hypothetical protein